MIVYLRNPRLSLWESWHAEGVTERGYEGPLRPGIRRATSPIGRGFGAINDHLSPKLLLCIRIPPLFKESGGLAM